MIGQMLESMQLNMTSLGCVDNAYKIDINLDENHEASYTPCLKNCANLFFVRTLSNFDRS